MREPTACVLLFFHPKGPHCSLCIGPVTGKFKTIEFPLLPFPSWVPVSPLEDDHHTLFTSITQVCSVQNLSHTGWETQPLGLSLPSLQLGMAFLSCACSWAPGKEGAWPSLWTCTSCSSAGSGCHSSHITHGFPQYIQPHLETSWILLCLLFWPKDCLRTLFLQCLDAFYVISSLISLLKSRSMFLFARTILWLTTSTLCVLRKQPYPLSPACVQPLFSYPTTLCSLVSSSRVHHPVSTSPKPPSSAPALVGFHRSWRCDQNCKTQIWKVQSFKINGMHLVDLLETPVIGLTSSYSANNQRSAWPWLIGKVCNITWTDTLEQVGLSTSYSTWQQPVTIFTCATYCPTLETVKEVLKHRLLL